MLSTTAGQLLLNEPLPDDLKDYNQVLDKKGVREKLRQVAEKYPERYRDISFRWSQIGRRVSQETGGNSFGLQHMRRSLAGTKTRQKIQARLQSILADDSLNDKQREELIIKAAGRESKAQQDAIYDEALAAGNPLAKQVQSGSRGNKMNLSSLLGSDLLYVDHHNRPIPVPILRSYSEGLSPEEYIAGAYGARKGVVDLKKATQDAGFFGKQLAQVAHRLVVTGHDYDTPEQLAILRGVPVDIDDEDNEGALLATSTGPFPKNTPLTPRIIKQLKRSGHKRLLVRSPMTGGSPEGGVYARDVGIRERGGLPGNGEQVGLPAAQAISEPITQAQIGSKHTGGVAGEGKAISGFDYINQLVQVPKTFKGGAAHSHVDGTVQRIEPAPAGGQYVTIENERHYVHGNYDLKVKKGDTVEAGDVISEGLPNPSEITHYKGIGEGRRYFTKAMRDAMRDANIVVHRRNLELVSRGLINHVRFTREHGDRIPDDVVPYSTLEHTYEPAEGSEDMEPKRAVGKYLQRPVLHYTIGTKVRPSMLQDFHDFKVHKLTVHDDPPPFEPEMVRAMYTLQHDPDWMTRMYGSGLKKSLLESTARGGISEERGTSFVPSLARAVDFGRQPGAAIHPPEPPIEVKEPSIKPASQPKKQSWFGGRYTHSLAKAALDDAMGNPYSRKPMDSGVSTGSKSNGGGGASAVHAGTGNKYAPAAQASAGKAPPAIAYGSAPQEDAANPGYYHSPNTQAKPAPQPQAAQPPQNKPIQPGAGGDNMLQSPMGAMAMAPMIQGMDKMMPGLGGTLGMGMLFGGAKGMRTLMGGKDYQQGDNLKWGGPINSESPDVAPGSTPGAVGGPAGPAPGEQKPPPPVEPEGGVKVTPKESTGFTASDGLQIGAQAVPTALRIAGTVLPWAAKAAPFASKVMGPTNPISYAINAAIGAGAYSLGYGPTQEEVYANRGIDTSKGLIGGVLAPVLTNTLDPGAGLVEINKGLNPMFAFHRDSLFNAGAEAWKSSRKTTNMQAEAAQNDDAGQPFHPNTWKGLLQGLGGNQVASDPKLGKVPNLQYFNSMPPDWQNKVRLTLGVDNSWLPPAGAVAPVTTAAKPAPPTLAPFKQATDSFPAMGGFAVLQRTLQNS